MAELFLFFSPYLYIQNGSPRCQDSFCLNTSSVEWKHPQNSWPLPLKRPITYPARHGRAFTLLYRFVSCLLGFFGNFLVACTITKIAGKSPGSLPTNHANKQGFSFGGQHLSLGRKWTRHHCPCWRVTERPNGVSLGKYV